MNNGDDFRDGDVMTRRREWCWLWERQERNHDKYDINTRYCNIHGHYDIYKSDDSDKIVKQMWL